MKCPALWKACCFLSRRRATVASDRKISFAPPEGLHPLGDVHRVAEHVLFLDQRLAGVQADAHLGAEAPIGLAQLEQGLLDRHRRVERVLRAAEDRQQAVADGLHHAAAVARDDRENQPVVPVEHQPAGHVAQAVPVAARIDDVREQDGDFAARLADAALQLVVQDRSHAARLLHHRTGVVQGLYIRGSTQLAGRGPLRLADRR